MAVYHLSTRINSNVPADSLLYDLCIYRMDSTRNNYPLVDVKQQPFLGNNETQSHMTGNINASLSTIYIMKMKLYRKTMLQTLTEWFEKAGYEMVFSIGVSPHAQKKWPGTP